MWARRIEREIDLGQKPAPKHQNGIKTVSDLIDLHIADMMEVGKELGRSKGFNLDLLRARLGKLNIAELNRGQIFDPLKPDRRRLWRGTAGERPLARSVRSARGGRWQQESRGDFQDRGEMLAPGPRRLLPKTLRCRSASS